MRRREDKIDIDIEATDLPEILMKEERLEMYQRYLPELPTKNNGLSKICRHIIKRKLIGRAELTNWLRQRNKINAQIILRELFHIFCWRLVKHHSSQDIYNFLRLSSKLKYHAEELGFTELSRYIQQWRDKLMKKNLRHIIAIRKEFIQKSRKLKNEHNDKIAELTNESSLPDTIDEDEDRDERDDRDEIIEQIIELLRRLKK